MSKLIGRKVKLVKSVRDMEGTHPCARDCHAVGTVLTIAEVHVSDNKWQPFQWPLLCRNSVSTYDKYCLKQVRYLNNKKVVL